MQFKSQTIDPTSEEMNAKSTRDLRYETEKTTLVRKIILRGARLILARVCAYEV